MSKLLLVGIDPHRKQNVVQMMNQAGQCVDRVLHVEHHHPGTQALAARLAEQATAGEFDAIRIATEATGWYWFHLLQTLSQEPVLNQWPLELYALNPRLVTKFKQTYSDLDKSDVIDAFAIADRLRLGRDLPRPFASDDLYRPLRCLTRYRRHVVLNLVREKAYCLAVLYLKASEYTRYEPFADVFGAASRAVLEEFASLEEIAALPFDQLVAFIDGKGRRHFADPAINARTLQQVAHDSYVLPLAMRQPVNTVLHLSLQSITALERQQQRLDDAIAEAMTAIPNTLSTIPGIGPVFAAGIIAEIAGVERFDYNEAKVAHYAGLKWRKTASADFQAEETPLAQSGNRYLRYYLCEAANIVRVHDADYKAFYDRKYAEVRKHQHKRAIVLTARKLVRLVVRLLTSHQPYQPRRPSILKPA